MDNKIGFVILVAGTLLIPALLNLIKALKGLKRDTCTRCKCKNPSYAKFCRRCGYAKDNYDKVDPYDHQIDPVTNICRVCGVLYNDLQKMGMPTCNDVRLKLIKQVFEGDSRTYSDLASRAGHVFDAVTGRCIKCHKDYKNFSKYKNMPPCLDGKKTLRKGHDIDPRTNICTKCGEDLPTLLSLVIMPECKRYKMSGSNRAMHHPGSNKAGLEIDVRAHAGVNLDWDESLDKLKTERLQQRKGKI